MQKSFNLPTLALALSLLGCSTIISDDSGSDFPTRPSNTTCLAGAEQVPPTNLADTGCAMAQDPTQPESGLIPYDINAPLWSDGAQKERWMALPDGDTVEIDEDGDWFFPIGTVLVKNFSVDGQLIETRHLKYHDNGVWRGYTYEWNEAVTEATLVPTEGKSRTLANGQTWDYPNRFQCLSCHTGAAGRSLGPETPQMNRLFTYPASGIQANQITVLSQMGVLENEPEDDPDALPRFPDLNQGMPSEDQIEAGARAYLHVNCSICHRPQGPGGGPEDFRALLPLQDTHTCDALPTINDFGITDARLLFPGSPEQSVLWFRMGTLLEGRMPPLATNVVDQFGRDLVAAWIESIESCP